MPQERFSLKDHLFNREKVSYLGGLLSSGVPGFDRARFEKAVMAEMLDLELKERIALIARVLADHLDPDFAAAAKQIEASLPPPLDPTLTDDDFGDFIIAPFGKFTEDNGLEYFEIAMPLLREITMRFSMEGSIRPFINRYPERALDVLSEWAHSENYHVRRLVSEATRPTLPWSPRIVLEPEQPLPMLDILHADSTRYVTRSVANHLNDVSKIEPELVLDRLAKWRGLERQDPVELEWMTRHSLRTLIKQGHPGAMEHLGYSTKPDVNAKVSINTPLVRAGETLEFSIHFAAGSDERLIVDYVIDFVKKNGSTKPKVFKLKGLEVKKGESINLLKRHRLKADATTYTLNDGTHGLTVVVNGKPVGSASFEFEDLAARKASLHRTSPRTCRSHSRLH